MKLQQKKQLASWHNAKTGIIVSFSALDFVVTMDPISNFTMVLISTGCNYCVLPVCAVNAKPTEAFASHV